MSDSSMDESPEYKRTAIIKELFIAQARCPNCSTLPMIEIVGGELLCTNCRKQYYEGPNHNFVRHVYEHTENAPNSLFKEKKKLNLIERWLIKKITWIKPLNSLTIEEMFKLQKDLGKAMAKKLEKKQ